MTHPAVPQSVAGEREAFEQIDAAIETLIRRYLSEDDLVQFRVEVTGFAREYEPMPLVEAWRVMWKYRESRRYNRDREGGDQEDVSEHRRMIAEAIEAQRVYEMDNAEQIKFETKCENTISEANGFRLELADSRKCHEAIDLCRRLASLLKAALARSLTAPVEKEKE